ncbi:spore protein [Brevibacillus panacihumi W25]|uniref:Spore protein n=2 Tax=Brevibacillus panacihumi TaxID=497735 RepID=V6M364_9BACL|nr:small acid-soluble spore protein Tlp [Brevibacillus panacihumi]EST52340.1 spore protein [Brevibacillus panacihumi W25]RNB73267.1 small acid-soluble spore protein Tlp [Brevibacillus panacihumi]
MPKPDDRSDNVEKLQDMLQDTEQNIRESQDYLRAHGDEISAKEKQDIEEKNQRREESIDGFRAEIQDEASQ